MISERLNSITQIFDRWILKITSKLLKYSPADVQSVTYVVEYAEHNYTGEARDAYLEKRLVTPTEKAIAEVIIEGKAGLYVVASREGCRW